MPVQHDLRSGVGGVDERSLTDLMHRIHTDMACQEAILRQDPASGEKAAQLLIILKEAQRRLDKLANSVNARKDAHP